MQSFDTQDLWYGLLACARKGNLDFLCLQREPNEKKRKRHVKRRTILTQVPGIRMVTQFVIDVMHTLDGGVMKHYTLTYFCNPQTDGPLTEAVYKRLNFLITGTDVSWVYQLYLSISSNNNKRVALIIVIMLVIKEYNFYFNFRIMFCIADTLVLAQNIFTIH